VKKSFSTISSSAYLELTLKREDGKVVKLHVEKLPEGHYLATSDTIQGLAAQGRTINETVENARDIAKKTDRSSGG